MTKGSMRLGTAFGIPVFVHWTFLGLLAVVGYLGMTSAGTAGLVWALSMTIALFGCVLLHELGHALAARRYGVKTRDIILLPVGGVARLERMPRDPTQEIVIALAGPAVNLVIAAVLLPIVWLTSGLGGVGLVAIGSGFLLTLMNINLVLLAFNLLPAFPMDGGRVLRALLAYRMDYLRSTQVAATVGKVMAVAFIAYGVFTGQFMLALVGMFVLFAATAEVVNVQRQQRPPMARPASWQFVQLQMPPEARPAKPVHVHVRRDDQP